MIKRVAHRVFNALGFDIRRLQPPQRPRDVLVDELISRQISVVLDGGANIGQFASHLRACGYLGKIISFEPLENAFHTLTSNAAGDEKWDCINLALGACEKDEKINVAQNSVSSSIRKAESRNVAAEPAVAAIDEQPTSIVPLDTIFPRLATPADRVFLKLDVQGYENAVFQGAEETLSRLEGVVVECALTELYRGAWLFGDTSSFLTSAGFFISNIIPGFSDPRTGELLEVDAVFWRKYQRAL